MKRKVKVVNNEEINVSILKKKNKSIKKNKRPFKKLKINRREMMK